MRATGIVEIRVVTEASLCLVPRDGASSGEVIALGLNVLSGYWQSLSAEFPTLPSASHAAFRDGWLLTGDTATLDNNCNITLKGRSKDVIICSGEKVWPCEVEQVLEAHPEVLQSCVYGMPDTVMGETVHAVVILQTSFTEVDASEEFRTACVAELNASCRKVLAWYKVSDTWNVEMFP